MKRSQEIAFSGWLVFVLLLGGCAPAPAKEHALPTLAGSPLPALTPAPASGTPRSILTVSAPPVGAGGNAPATATAVPTLAAGAWKSYPVVPPVSSRALEIYRSGLAMGNRPEAFSKVGDCESITDWYLADFDGGSYSLGPYREELEGVIRHYKGSFKRRSLAAKPGFTAAALMTPLWADDQKCAQNEAPLACEYRLHRPSVALITLGTNDVHRPETFEADLRRVIEYSIQQGVLPVLATKADNLEKDESINATIARLAQEYEIPLWNFWLAVQPLHNHGLQEDGAHLTWGVNDFSDPGQLKQAWPVRNLTALQVLNAVWQSVKPGKTTPPAP